MNIDSIKSDIIDWINTLEDEQTLQELLHFKEGDSFLSDDQKNILNERIEKYEAGDMKFSEWKSVKSRIENKSTDDL
ncbi:MAG: hypothetical protein JJ895_02070 [Balneolaceae bacterium]|nr:hypothetical protein [Balneolaceae bacterium]